MWEPGGSTGKKNQQAEFFLWVYGRGIKVFDIHFAMWLCLLPIV